MAAKEEPVIQDEAAFTYETGDMYQGNFEIRKKERSIKMNGLGVYTTAEGDTYTTVWDNESLPLNLETTVVYADGSKYQGCFKEWKYCGSGKYSYPDGSLMECQFTENCPMDNLTYVDPNGHMWLGEAEMGFGWVEPINHYYDLLICKDSEKQNKKRHPSPSSDIEAD